MKLSCVCTLDWPWLVASRRLAPARLALDAPHTLHHAKATQPHLTETHRAASHRATGPFCTHPARTSATAHAPATQCLGKSRRRPAADRQEARQEPARARWPSIPAAIATTSALPPVPLPRGRYSAGDITAGEDPVVRQAAIDALGDMNGTAVVIDPSNGRILAMVNQKLALSPGAEPCSTIKLTVALAALSEGLVTRDTPVQLAGFRMNMTQALAKSNNLYFEELGRELGFERVRHYANQFGLGELAGYHIEGEQLGVYPDQELPAAEGGVGRMCSFGQGVSLTPLQLGAFVAAIANGGTLYYLQHPTTPEEAAKLRAQGQAHPGHRQVRSRHEDGMAGAVEYGTARRLRANFNELPVFGKTGTCSDKGTRFGWFASYSDSPQGSLVTVFFLEGGRPTFGPRAAELTGEFYKNLWDQQLLRRTRIRIAKAAPPATASSHPEPDGRFTVARLQIASRFSTKSRLRAAFLCPISCRTRMHETNSALNHPIE